MNNKYNIILQCISQFKSIREICDETGLGKGAVQFRANKLVKFGYAQMIQKSTVGSPIFYKRIVELLNDEQIAELCSSKNPPPTFNCPMNDFSAFGIVVYPVPSGRKISPETDKDLIDKHIQADKKRREDYKSPRNYVGCSFNQVGW